jgi:RimJ/RimL family protein N-acetyltransferase
MYHTVMTIPIITTPRLTLRPFTMEDLNPLFEILQQPNIFQYFPRPGTPSLERVERIIAFYIKQAEDYSFSCWAVDLKETGELIGWCGLNHLPETDEDEVAYLLSQAHHGEGYATEAARASLDFGFNTIGLARIIALVHPENIASQRVIQKSGMAFLDRKLYWDLELLRYEKFKMSSPH